jgi:serine phosphatase RsbU (regulator of sigma subunit)/putative methionine-R-sulfoxide reductase with GAF domain
LTDFSQQEADPEWKQLLRLGEQLTGQPTPEAQRDQIARSVGQLLSAQARVWFASPVYPLPGMPEMETLPRAPATPLAHQALEERRRQCAPAPPPGDQEGGTCEPLSIALPVMAREVLLGVVQVDRPEGPGFSRHELSLLEGLVAHAAAALELSRQETLKDWSQEQLNLVRSVSAKIASLTNLNDLYDQVTRLIEETFAYYYVAVFNLDERAQLLAFRGSASQNQAARLPDGFTIQAGEGIIGSVGQSGVEIVAPDVRQEARYRHLEALPETLSEAALPLKIENRVLGVLDIQSDRVDAFHENDMLVLRALADNIALAIESTRLYSDLDRHAGRMSAVFEVGHALASILDLDALLDQVVQLIHDRFHYPFVHVYTVHPGRRLVIYQAGTGERSAALKQQGQTYPLDAPQGIIAWVARSGQTYLSNDVTSEPLYLPSELSPAGTRSEIAIPLSAGDEVLGVLDIHSQAVEAFDESDRALFEALAAPVAVAMRNATLYRSEQWRRKVAESFRDVAHLISANLPLNQLLDIILEKLERNLPCNASAIWLLDEETDPANNHTLNRVRLAAARNIRPEQIFEALQEKTVQEMLERSLSAGQPLIRGPEDPPGPLGAALGYQQNYSSIAAPMQTGQRPLGVIMLAHEQEGRYGIESQAITATFASYAAVAIQNARLYNETQEQALISTMLLQVAEASQSILNVDDLLATMIRMTRLLVGVKKSAFLLWEDGLQSFVLKAWYGFEPAGEEHRLVSSRLPAAARLIDERTTLYIDDPAHELQLPELSLSPEPGTVVMLPLLVRGEAIGAFLVSLQMAWTPGIETGFDPKALAILQGIAHQTSITIDNLRLLEARQEEAYVTAALLQVAQAVVGSSDLNDTLDTIVHLLPILVGIDTCVIYLWDSASRLFRPTQVYAENRREEEAILGLPFAPGEHTLLDVVRQTGEMHLCQLVDGELPYMEWSRLPCQAYTDRLEQPTLSQSDWVLGYPLSLQGQVLGVLMVRETNVSPAFWERRMEIIFGIAQQVSLAIQNDLLKQEMVQTERIEREIQLARQIQETFLPDALPQISRWELDMRWETAREVGGDFYDVFKLEGNRVGLVIADVSDKGLPAALYMTVARTLIRANAADSQSPADVLTEVNKLLVSDSAEAMFITAVYIILSLDTGELVYANAGHNLPLLFRRKKNVLDQLPKGGTALGVIDDLTLENHSLLLRPGDVLMLYTDGVTDALSPDGDFFGEDRLFNLVRLHGRETVQNLLEALDDALLDFRRGLAPVDDITLVAVRREPGQKKRAAAEQEFGEGGAEQERRHPFPRREGAGG